MPLPERHDTIQEAGTLTNPDMLRASGAIAVNSSGEAFTELTRTKEAIIVSEHLDSAHPVVKVDLEKIITERGGDGVSIVIQDFGLPPRVITVRGDFINIKDVAGMERTKEHYRSVPKQLEFEVISPETNGTYHFDERGLPTKDYGTPVVLSRGETMLWAHDGEPSDQRTGYIGGSMWELVAQLPHDYWGEPDFSDALEIDGGLRRGFVPLIGLHYEGNTLSVYSLDDVHAEVQYQQVRSLADEIPKEDKELSQLSEVDIETIVKDLVAGDAVAREALIRVVSERMDLADQLKITKEQLADSLRGNDNLETLLAVNKGKLRDARQEAARLADRVRKLETEPRNSKSSDAESLFDILGGKQATEADPHGYCSQLGLSPGFLLNLDSETAKKVVRGVHKGLVTGFHPDKNRGTEAEEIMKGINNAVDGVLARLEQGYWNRR